MHRLPGRSKVSNLTFKRGITKSNDFFKWYLKILQGSLERKNVDVVMFDEAGKELAKWSFSRAFPVKWIGPQLTADGKTAAIETLELAHDGLLE